KWLLEGNYLQKELRCPLVQRSELEKKKAPFRYTGNAAICQYFPKPAAIPGNPARIVLAAEMYGAEDGFTSPTHFNMTIWGVSDSVAKQPSRAEREGSSYRPQYHGGKE